MAYASWSVVFGEQPTAAKWNILGTNDASFNDGTGLNTGAIQQQVSTTTSAVATGTTVLPVDNTIPQNTEGDQYMTLAITPKSTTNILWIFIVGYLASSVLSDMTMALFQDSTANALAVAGSTIPVAHYSNTLQLFYPMTAGTTSATTFKMRAGPSTAGTTTFNGANSTQRFSTTIKSSMRILEFKG